jgi:carboxyl-terminal processing protease
MDKFRADGKKNLVLDLRGNGGGYVKIASSIASYFCKNATGKRPVIAVEDYGEYQAKTKADGNYYNDYFSSNSRICVLADVNTASASETLIGAMLDYGTISYGDICLSELSGVCKTYGKGIIQTTYPLLFGGDVVKLTTAVIRWPISNHCIHGRGILVEDGALSVPRNLDFDAGIADSLEKLFTD